MKNNSEFIIRIGLRGKNKGRRLKRRRQEHKGKIITIVGIIVKELMIMMMIIIMIIIIVTVIPILLLINELTGEIKQITGGWRFMNKNKKSG